ncbi:accessory Sec system S-layer assembly protein [Tenuibacillus multivorans]|uniref:Accessory Sec system S-layer assembly protein n=1 Tax=Tenuibacillus multivorans TaxID=237069 RepID=A0A1H0G622_9BACI|nr:accessory Sec system S-layer assembly protein [Tenuibacillus multivorans]GEL78728.1 accessory Sec system S-layer assembly protein [Tenuibacillus multivorans]SDO02338.1 accessory Sec system S-layer assembly protein [Tenuibacillus multivorans]
MLNPFKRRQDSKVKGKDTSIDADQLVDEVDEDSGEQEVSPELSIHPQWKIEEEDLYVYRFQNNGLEPLKPNQLSLAGFELNIVDDKRVVVGAFVRHSLSKTIKLDETSIVLLDHDGKKLGRKSFNLSKLGDLPAQSSRPWIFEFKEKDLFVNVSDIPTEDFQLAFELKKKRKEHQLELADSWKNSLASKDVQKLEEITKSVNPPKPGEVNFMGLDCKFLDSGNLQVTLLIRNGSEKEINLEQIPLVVEDKAGDTVAKGGFKMEDFKVTANTSKPWNFIFPEDLIMKPDADLSQWKAYPPQN